jgi:hypothetical protein
LTATLNASTGLSDSVMLACSGTSQLTCTFSPSFAQVTGGAAQTVAITVNTSAIAFNETKPVPPPVRNLIAIAGLFPLALCCGLVRGRRCNLLLVLLLGFTAFVFVEGCGGGGGSGGGGGGGGSNTYSLTVTATPGGTSIVNTLGIVTVTVTH